MDVLLVSPPVANFGQASSGISVLTAYLRSRGWDAHAWDLAIDAFHHFHSRESMARCLEALVARGDDREAVEAARRVAATIEEAKDSLRTPGVEQQPDVMRHAFDTIEEAGHVMTAAARGKYSHDFRQLSVPGAFSSFDALGEAIVDPERNPYLAYFDAHALPRIEASRPRALGISITYFSQLLPGVALVHRVRERFGDIPIVVGGACLTALGEQVSSIPPAVLPADAVVLHDGEEALDRWLRATLEDHGDVEAVPNAYLRDGGRLRRAAEHAVAQTDLDSLPSPMWIPDGLDLDRYLVPQYPIPLPLSRGCYWGRCAYCNISSQTSASYRTRSVDLAISDMKGAMAATGSSWFDFPVDSFRVRELHALARRIVDEGVDVRWGAEVLLDPNFTEEVIADLWASGCRCLRFGLESASLSTLKAMNKPTKPHVARRILGDCKAHGIRTAVMLIAGFPTESQAALRETYDYLVDNADRIDFLTVHSYSLVPGSPMAEDPGAWGLFLKPKQGVLWSSLPFENTNPVAMRNDDLPRVVAAMREGLREHYPHSGEMWAVAIGGWMTFPACCEPSAETEERWTGPRSSSGSAMA